MARQVLQHCTRDGIIFVIDCTQPMFEIDPQERTLYFYQCLETYRNILSEKLSWNRTDWMGIILMGTKDKWDRDPEIKDVLTWQIFGQVSIEQMIKIEETLRNVEKFHSEIGSSSKYPLHQALWHAARSFDAIKIQIPFRKIVLLTRADNPCADEPNEQRRIRLKASDCNQLNIQLSIVGLGKDWNPEHFFQELEIESGKFDKPEDYQRTFLTDLEEEIKHASKITAKLQWTIGKGVTLGVSVSTIIAKTKFPKKIRLKRENNEPLEVYSFYQKPEAEFLTDEEDEDEDGKIDNPKIALPKNVYKYQEFGGREIKFSIQEVSRLGNLREPGINLLGFQPLSSLDLSLHLDTPKFVTYNESKCRGSKALFAALLKRCEEQNVMAICVVTFRGHSSSYTYAMIPDTKYSGFYAYKLPFAENVRDMASILPEYVYDETDNVCPIDEDTVALCHKFMKQTTIAYDPSMFRNPKLQAELAKIESMAMDQDVANIPIDSTLADKETAQQRLDNLKDLFEETVRIHDPVKPMKRPGRSSSNTLGKMNKVDEMIDFQELVRIQMVDECTVKQLRDHLKSVGAHPAGRKSDLVDMVYTLYEKT